MTLNQQLLTELIPLVEKKLAAADAEAGEFDRDHYTAWRERQRAAENRVMDFFTDRYDARFAAQGDTHMVVMAGIRSTSTSGWSSAFRNWRASAEKKLGPDPTRKGKLEALHHDGFNPFGSGPVPIEPRED